VDKTSWRKWTRGKLIGIVALLALTACTAQQPQPSSSQPQVILEQYRVWQPLAEQGNADAQLILGEMYYYGRGVGVDYALAANWYRKAAEQDNAAAAYSLGYLYEMGHGVARDYGQAFALYSKAAGQGYAQAQFRLAELYANGHGTNVDRVQAYAWYDIASARLDGPIRATAAERRDKIAQRMKAADLGKAKQFVSDCRESNFTACGSGGSALVHLVDTNAVPPPAVMASHVTFLTSGRNSVKLESIGGVYTVPAKINDTVTLKFIVDSGAADVTIPSDVIVTLMRNGTLQATDFRESRTFTTANGGRTPLKTFRIRSLKVGDVVVTDVTGIVAAAKAPPLLGQSFFNQFKSWSIDNHERALVLE
jgi:clan AA aspartic protease (TIGR02281 family)